MNEIEDDNLIDAKKIMIEGTIENLLYIMSKGKTNE